MASPVELLAAELALVCDDLAKIPHAEARPVWQVIEAAVRDNYRPGSTTNFGQIRNKLGDFRG